MVVVDIGSTEVDLVLIRAMFEICPGINLFYISKQDMDWVRNKHANEDPHVWRSMFINTSDPVWHTQVMMVEEMDKTNTFIGTDQKGGIVMAIIHPRETE